MRAVCFLKTARQLTKENCGIIFDAVQKKGNSQLFLLCDDVCSRRICFDDFKRVVHSFYSCRSRRSVGTSYRFFLDDFELLETMPNLETFSTVFVNSQDDVPDVINAIGQQQPLELINISLNEQIPEKSDESSFYHGVVLGGTFDRLHFGHDILLTISSFLALNKIVIGVTDDNYVKNRKTLWELIQPASTRVAAVEEYIKSVKPSLIRVIEAMPDSFGPSIRETDIDAIVVSTETIKGGEAVIRKRLDLQMNSLEIKTIDLVEDNHGKDEFLELEEKFSSSNFRKHLLGTRLAGPFKPNKDLGAYIVGLTGGIACGKTSLAEKIVAAVGNYTYVINCDKLGHEAYQSGSSAFQKIKNEFGESVISVYADGSEEVDRRILGSLVFNDKIKLEKLNSIVWPVIADKVEKIVKSKAQEGLKLIFIDAALLLEAGWNEYCHEVWTCIVPEKDAAERVKIRNPEVPEDEILKRIRSQISNKGRVEASTVVFSTQWSHDFTTHQLKLALRTLPDNVFQL